MPARQILDPEELRLADWLRPSDRVMWGQGGAEPLTLVETLVEQRASLSGLRVFLTLAVSELLRPEHADHLRFQGLGGLGTNKTLSRAGVLDPYPVHFSHLRDDIAAGTFPIDVAFVHLAGPDADGRYSAGIDQAYLLELIGSARVVIGEVNAQMPFVVGEGLVEPDQLDVVIHTDRPLPEMVWHEPDAVDDQIADHIAALVPDGATIQVGVGSVPSAVLRNLRSHKDLGIHTGMISDAVLDLALSDAVTNELKPFDVGLTVGCIALGSRSLYERVTEPPFVLRSAGHTHAADVLGALPRFTAINSALQVDLSGQANAEFVGAGYVGAVGGQVDFVRGARRSPGGRSITALRTRTASGHSRITTQLAGGVVTTARSDVDTVVTEWGVAELAHLTLSERAEALIAIAHPEDRARLTEGSTS